MTSRVTLAVCLALGGFGIGFVLAALSLRLVMPVC